MNRAERKRKERELEKQNTVYEKLTPAERETLVNWTNRRLANTWENMEKRLFKIMRSRRISENRIDLIFKDFRENTEMYFKEEK